MKTLGYIAIALSIIIAIGGLSMDTSVPTNNGQRVHNLGLLQTQRNMTNIGMFGVAVGIVLVAIGRRKKSADYSVGPVSDDGLLRKCPFCAEEIKIEAIRCKHCGSDVPPATVETLDEAAKRLGITIVGMKYFYKGRNFSNLADAVAWATMKTESEKDCYGK